MAKKISALLLTVWMLCATVLPVHATEIHSENAVEITCDFEDAANIEVYPATIYQVSIDGQYLVAEFRESDCSYIFTGYTTSATGATRFQFGNNTEQPEKLVISNLPDGTYHFEESNRLDGYYAVDFDISFSPNGVFVDGTNCIFEELTNGKRGFVYITYCKPFKLPMSEPVNTNPQLTAIGVIISLGSLIALIIILIHVIYSKREET